MGARRRLVSAVTCALVGWTVAGCGGMPPQVGAQGIDGLQIPIPEPRAADFVAGLDHPWFAPAGGQDWTLAATAAGAPSSARLRVRVRSTQVIAGVTTTAVRTKATGQPGWTDWYAQDREGNLWQFGHRGGAGQVSWMAGQDGYQAGLLIAATPRTGDGYPTADADGEPVRIAEVVGTAIAADTPSGTYDTVGIRFLDPATGLSETYYFAEDVGLVALTSGTQQWGRPE